MSAVSIILAIHNGLSYTQQCIAVLQDNLKGCDYELIVVDDASEDGTLEWLSQQESLKRIHNESQQGLSRAFNQGAEASSGETLLLLRNDVLLMRMSFVCMMQLLGQDEAVGAVGPYTNHDRYLQTLQCTSYQNYTELEQFVAQLPGKIEGAVAQPSLLLGDFCLLMKRSAWDAIHGFDISYTGASFFADADISLRLIQAGYRLQIARNAYVHREAMQWKDRQSNLDDEMAKGNAYFEQKWQFRIQYSCNIRLPLIKHIEQTRKPLAVLEAGCACGGNLMYLEQVSPGAELYGIELDSNTAKIASCFGQIFNLDLERFSKPEWTKKFDAIIMGDILEHLVDPWKTVRNMYEITKSGGRIIISVPNIMHVSIFYGLLQGSWTYEDQGILDRTHLRFFTKREAVQLLEQAGYKVISVEYSDFGMSESMRQVYPKLLELLGDGIEPEQLRAYQWIMVGERC